MKRHTKSLLLAAGLAVLPSLALAQAHYPAGAEGIKGASLPPPGTYLRDYNLFYTADRLPDAPFDFDVFAYVNAPRLIWMTDQKILGATYGMDIILPFGYQCVKINDQRLDDGWSFGDIQLEPVVLAWHTKRMDIAAGYALWAPTGESDRPAGLGKGYWGHMLTLGGTYYFDEAKTWALSALNRYEINHEHKDFDLTPGNEFTVEFALSKSLRKTIDIGAVGYFQWQTTKDSGSDSNDVQDQVVGLGPEISTFCPRLKLFTSLRYLYELGANDRPEGHTITLTITKVF